jgi:murein DD-endopeptidase MepM/ murein hydrolase activator NlpD
VLTPTVSSAQKQKKGKQTPGKSQQRSRGRSQQTNHAVSDFERTVYRDGFVYDPEKWDDKPYVPAGIPSTEPLIMDGEFYGTPGRFFPAVSMFLENQLEKRKKPDEDDPEGELFQEPILAFDVLRRREIKEATDENNPVRARFLATYNGYFSLAEEFIQKIKPEIPFVEPYDARKYPAVRISNAWWGNTKLDSPGDIVHLKHRHFGIDYAALSSFAQFNSTADRTFEVRAIAEGIVQSVLWLPGGGNVVVIKHTVKNNSEIELWSIYGHLCNGFKHDLEHARNPNQEQEELAIAHENGMAKFTPERLVIYLEDLAKYKAFAWRPEYSNDVFWGTEEHVIKVKVGEFVKAGQVIGYAGSTGSMVYRESLNKDGTLNNRRGPRVHLHLNVAAFHDALEKFVLIDPYGAYSALDFRNGITEAAVSSGYSPFSITKYARLFNPIGDGDFSQGVPLPLFTQIFGYYANLGMMLNNDFRIEYVNGLPVAFGSFDSRPKEGPSDQDYYAMIYLPLVDRDEKRQVDIRSKGYLPFKVFITLEPQPNNQPPVRRMTSIWRKAKLGESAQDYFETRETLEQHKKESAVKGSQLEGYQLDWLFPFVENGTQRYLSIFAKGRPREPEPAPTAGVLLNPAKRGLPRPRKR